MTGPRSWRGRAVRYLFSRANLFGLAAAAVAVVVGAAFGLFGAWWPLAAAGAYGAAARLAPRETGHRIDVDAARTARDVERALDQVVATARDHTDSAVLNRITRIRELTLSLLQERGSPEVDSQLTTIGQIALEYLPTTLENYLNVPNLYRRTVRGSDGNTARDELLGQLTLLGDELRNIEVSLGAGRLRDLAEQRVFLETRFSDPLTW